MTKTLKILDCKPDFKFQGPRFRKFGESSGEEFRDDFLIPWLDTVTKDDIGIVDFSGTKVYMSSFLEESFGGAVRKGYGDKVSGLKFTNIEQDSLRDLNQYIGSALGRI